MANTMKSRRIRTQWAAVRFAEHWRNGNRRFVLDEIDLEPTVVALSLVAYMMAHMQEVGDETTTFLQALATQMDELGEDE